MRRSPTETSRRPRLPPAAVLEENPSVKSESDTRQLIDNPPSLANSRPTSRVTHRQRLTRPSGMSVSGVESTQLLSNTPRASNARVRHARRTANRAMCGIKLGRWADAEADCTEALRLDSRYLRSYQRQSSPVAVRKPRGDHGFRARTPAGAN